MDATDTTWSVGAVAAMTGTTVRTLHHYDEIGLVVAGRTHSGHRRYGTNALERLQQVLFFRELGFPLDDIRQIMNDPGFDRRQALMQQRDLVLGKMKRLEGMVEGIDLAILALDEGLPLSADDLFGDDMDNPHAHEAKERWGDTEAYTESQRRTKRYTKEDWAAIKAEAEGISRRFAAALRSGESADSAEAVSVAEAHRLHIDTRFYPCSKGMHRNLGDMYVQDDRFTAYWDAFEPGLAEYVRDAIAANAARE
jgi:DNA-binding transcriptional MerR regulator